MPQTRLTVDSETKLIALLGWPVKHSASPRFHNAALEALGINAIYLAFAVPPDHLRTALRGLAALGAIGANVTVPHKQAAFALCDECSPEAKVIAAVNTICFENGRLIGYNTDAYGIAAALAEEGLTLHAANVVVLGAGGAARAIVTQAVLDGAAQIFLINRTLNRAEHLLLDILENCRQLPPDVRRFPLPRCQVLPYDDIRRALVDAHVLINATSVGLKDDDPLLFDPNLIHPSTLVYDTIYNPPQTRLLIAAKQAGCQKTANGLSMLLYQGARAFELWFKRPAPLELMRKELLQPRTRHRHTPASP
ncbi:MAG: shikimate dehydrogenase [bacterium]|nr:shikimate dehydrogenase [bacterium]